MTARRSGLATAVAAVVFQAADPAVPPRAADTYELDISEKRIQRPGFEAGSNVRLAPADGGVHIEVGAGVSARAIDIVLRNVHGTVRFRADTSRLDAFRLPAPPPPRPATPDPDQQ